LLIGTELKHNSKIESKETEKLTENVSLVACDAGHTSELFSSLQGLGFFAFLLLQLLLH
jgi:hypothetical protein